MGMGGFESKIGVSFLEKCFGATKAAKVAVGVALVRVAPSAQDLADALQKDDRVKGSWEKALTAISAAWLVAKDAHATIAQVATVLLALHDRDEAVGPAPTDSSAPTGEAK